MNNSFRKKLLRRTSHGLAFLFFLTYLGNFLPNKPAEAAELSGKKYVGMQHPPFPGECRNQGGALIFPKDKYGNLIDGKKDLGYTIAICNGIYFIWLDKFLNISSKDKPLWKVIDSLNFPALEVGQKFVSVDCDFNGKNDPLIFATGRWVSTKQGRDLRDIVFAARIDELSQKNKKLIKMR